MTGEANHYRRGSDSGYDVTFHFCPQCGTSVYWEPRRQPDLLGVAVGCFADPKFPKPSRAASPEHRHPWIRIPHLPGHNVPPAVTRGPAEGK